MFQVIGDRIITPSSIVFLVVKLRLSPPSLAPVERTELDGEETRRLTKSNEEKDEEFLLGRKEAEDPPSDDLVIGTAHAPYWPGVSWKFLCAS